MKLTEEQERLLEETGEIFVDGQLVKRSDVKAEKPKPADVKEPSDDQV